MHSASIYKLPPYTQSAISVVHPKLSNIQPWGEYGNEKAFGIKGIMHFIGLLMSYSVRCADFLLEYKSGFQVLHVVEQTCVIND